MANESGILDPDDCINAVRSELEKPTIKEWIGGSTRVSVQKLDATRAWRTQMPKTGVRLEGGLLKDDTGNHLFMCMQRRGQAL